MPRHPKVDSEGVKELQKVEAHVSTLTDEIKNPDLNEKGKLPQIETEAQTKLSSQELKRGTAIHVKPLRSISSKEKFNDKYRAAHRHGWEYVQCIVENKEIIGEAVELWTKRFAGDPAHFWKVPVNKPIYIPRLLAEQLTKCKYSRLKMQADEREITSSDGHGTYIGALQFSETVSRIECKPVGFTFADVAP